MNDSTGGGAPQGDTVTVDTDVVACDGDGELDHPRVFLSFGEAATIDCPYCGRRFVHAAGGQHTAS
jgi:uncharacterized Zn-finger protein